MLIATKPQEAADLQQRQALLQQHGITATFVDGDEARHLEPALGTPRPPPELGSAVAVEGALVTSSDTQIVSGCFAGHVAVGAGRSWQGRGSYNSALWLWGAERGLVSEQDNTFEDFR